MPLKHSAINRIIKEVLDNDITESFSIQGALAKPEITNILEEEYKLNEAEIETVRGAVAAKFETISSPLKRQRSVQQGRESLSPTKRSLTMASLQMSAAQKKELDFLLTIDYTGSAAQPGIRSLYYLSKIAETLQLRILVPPTVLIGFGDDNRLLYND